jgi:single-strand DNA-binding protein
MSNETTITVVGNLTADPEMRFTGTGKSVAGFTIAATPRRLDKNTGQWTDGEALFMRCNLWGPYAENAVESLAKGMAVMATGRLKQRSYEDRDGIKRTVVELDVEEVGPTLRFATAKVTRAARNGQPQAPGAGVQRSTAPAEADPWTGGHSADEPPF